MNKTKSRSLKFELNWSEVIERRADELRSGKVKGIPAGEVMQKLKIIVDLKTDGLEFIASKEDKF